MLAFAAVAVAGVLLRPLLPIDETRYLSVAWGMHLDGNFLVPHMNGAEYSDKPPLLFWLINLVWSVTGVSGIAARLVGPAFALGSLGLTALLARRLWPGRPDVAPRAVVILASFSIFAIYGGLTMFDAVLTFWTLAAMLALVAAVERRRAWPWLAFGAAVGMGILTKGPVILFHTVPVLALCRLWAPAETRPSAGALLRGSALALAVALAVAAAWLVPALLTAGPGYREATLWTQSAGRMTSSFAHARGWWWFLALLPVLLFPWGWSPAIWRGVAALPRSDRGVRLCAIWAGAALLLFSLTSGKQVHYLLPEFPAVALLLARAGLPDRPPRVWAPAAALLVLAGVGLAAAAGLLHLGDGAGLVEPPAAPVAWAFALAGLAWIGIATGGYGGLAAMGLGLVLSLDLLIGVSRAGDSYGGTGIVALLRPGDEAEGIAVTSLPYSADFNFTARLRQPVATLGDAATLDAWGRRASPWADRRPPRRRRARLGAAPRDGVSRPALRRLVRRRQTARRPRLIRR